MASLGFGQAAAGPPADGEPVRSLLELSMAFVSGIHLRVDECTWAKPEISAQSWLARNGDGVVVPHCSHQ
jgi:hypothetical protein